MFAPGEGVDVAATLAPRAQGAISVALVFEVHGGAARVTVILTGAAAAPLTLEVAGVAGGGAVSAAGGVVGEPLSMVM